MALEDARKFLQIIEKDEDLKQRLSKMTLEESLAYASESGLDVTIADLEEAAKAQEISPETMDEVAGGHIKSGRLFAGDTRCPGTPNGVHKWVITSREIAVEKILFWKTHTRFDNWTCSICGKTKKTKA